MSEEMDKRKEEIRERLSRKSKKAESEDITPADIETAVEIGAVPEEEFEWTEVYIRGMSAALKCEKCGNEVIAKSERRKTMPVGEKAYLYCKTCNMSYHHECIGYSVLVRKA